jgi:threonine/homoserine/homoserine lactone efflux protein
MNWHLFAGFLAITMVLLLAPGPIVTLVISTSATRGMRAGLITVAGTSTGNAVLIAAIACGLSWVLAHAVYLFEALRWLGAVYLVWLGVQAWLHAGRPPAAAPAGRVHFRRGFVVALTNPKTIAFFSAFLPQFVDPRLPAAPQLTVMCLVTVLLAAVSDSCWAIASGLGRAFFLAPRRARLLGRVSGLTLIGGGIWLSLARRPVV